ncbi:L,D-transpeptidase [Maribacter sp. ACAM166]|nr:L,D-transpeptidase [Maribacter sp. ACAM166]
MVFLISCHSKKQSIVEIGQVDFMKISQHYNNASKVPKRINISENIRVGTYFEFMDSLVRKYDTLMPYTLSEHLLVRHNPWIMDTLANTDYYRMIARDSFVYNQRQMIVLPKGSHLIIPDSLSACTILENFANTEIDINIPEFKLRIYQDSILLYTFPVRVGQHRERYLKFGDRITDLRTKIGKGSIVKHVKYPDFYNPVNGAQFYVTKRDDGKTTMMPQIPWIETEINNIRNGQMIHPTTNPKTLGKAYSNGCIGIGEADAWTIYYHTPLGTKITLRYDLEVYDEGVVLSILRDVYGLSN